MKEHYNIWFRRKLYFFLTLKIGRTLKQLDKYDSRLQDLYLTQSWYNSHLGIYR